MSERFNPTALYQGMVRHGHIIPTGVAGVFGRGDAFERVIDGISRLALRAASDEAVERVMFPPVIDRTIIEKTGYMESFPHLIGSIHSYKGKEVDAQKVARAAASGENWGTFLEATEVVLAPAACYPLYPTLAGTLPAGGRTVALCGWAFRHEPSPEPTRMQAFRVQEIIRVGTPDSCLEWRDKWHERGKAIIASLGLNGVSDVAADPFFGRGGRMLAINQKQQKLKFEIGVAVLAEDQLTAVCSFNYHQSHFGETFGIHTEGGEVAHTACLGFGMERLVMALFHEHGFALEKWPAEVQRELGLE